MLGLKRFQKGASITELMIGITIGLVIMSGAIKLFGDYIHSNRATLASARLNQELRAATDLIARDLRRAGYWQNAINGVWYTGSTGIVSNPYVTVTTSGATQINYNYAKDATNTVQANEAFGFQLDSGTNTLKMFKDGEWIELTDPSSTTVTAFSITPDTKTVSLMSYCVTVVSNTLQMGIRTYDISITAQSKTDSTITRQIKESVRVRNDSISGAC